MIDVLLPPFEVSPRGLDMTVPIFANPNIAPGGRNHQPLNSSPNRPIDGIPFFIEVSKMFVIKNPRDSVSLRGGFLGQAKTSYVFHKISCIPTPLI
jgi:hypothetical protein